MSDGITDMDRGYDDDGSNRFCLVEENNKLKSANEDLKTRLTDLLFEMNYNKQTELIEFLREIYYSIKEEMKDGLFKSNREEILFSLKKNIEEFVKNNNILL
jgi:predicted transcriptional regulator